jgi:hypothetical protein
MVLDYLKLAGCIILAIWVLILLITRLSWAISDEKDFSLFVTSRYGASSNIIFWGENIIKFVAFLALIHLIWQQF